MRRIAGDPDRVFLAMLTMAVAQFFDFGTFFVMVQRHGVGSEANPLVAGILTDLGIPAAALVKAALVLLVAATAATLTRGPGSRRGRQVASVVLGVGILAGLVGGFTNALTLGQI